MLLIAVGVGSADIANFLVEIGADPNVHDGVIMALSLSLVSAIWLPDALIKSSPLRF
jgi:hypothetical protein